MRISIADNTGLKFCKDLMDHWIERGHEVRYERGASEYLAQWADLYYVEWIEGNLNYLWKIYNGAEGVSRTPDWDNNKKPKIVCRLIDWDLWNAYVPFYADEYFQFIDTAICIAPHMQDYILSKKPEYKEKLHLIRPGVNLDKFSLKTKETDGFQLGAVLGDMWLPKNHMGALDIFTTLYQKDNRWRFHLRGQHEGGTEYWKVMYEHYLDSRGIRDAVTLYAPVDDMNAWFENIDILLHTGMKEAFSYAVGEAMAKGIPPVINNFYGSDRIWGDVTYNTHSEAIEAIEQINKMFQNLPKEALDRARSHIRDIIATKHSNEKMFEEFDRVLGL